MNTQATTNKTQGWHLSSGVSLIESLVVVAIAAVLTAVAVPQVISARRLMRSSALPREVATQLRFARQQAMSQRQAFTFQYDDSTKQIRIIDHNNNGNPTAACNIAGKDIVADPLYPNTACSTTVLSVPLAGTNGSLPSYELSFGVPTGLSGVSTLDDTTTPTVLTAGRLNINFQPDGSVIDAAGNPVNRTLFLYNNRAATYTAAAISVLGTGGRVKVWRYSSSANKYAE